MLSTELGPSKCHSLPTPFSASASTPISGHRETARAPGASDSTGCSRPVSASARKRRLASRPVRRPHRLVKDPRPCHGAVEHMVDKAAGSKAQTPRHAAKLRHAAGAVKQKDSRPLFLPRHIDTSYFTRSRCAPPAQNRHTGLKKRRLLVLVPRVASTGSAEIQPILPPYHPVLTAEASSEFFDHTPYRGRFNLRLV